MPKTTVKGAANKSTVTKKAATKRPVAKKAATKRPVAKKAAAKKAAVPAKKPVAAKRPIEPISKPAKKTTVQKSVTKKAVAKKAVVKKSTVKKPTVKKSAGKKPLAKQAIAKKVVAPKEITAAPVNTWLNKEPELPVFLQNQNSEIKKEVVATQKYNQKSNNSVKYALVVVLVLLLGWGVNSYYLSSGREDDVKSQNNSSSTSDSNGSTAAGESANSNSNNQSPNPSSGNETKNTSEKPVVINSSPSASSAGFTDVNPSPRTFTSVKSDQGAILKWLAPKNIGKVVAYELYGRIVGQTDWILLSTVTTDQLDVEVDLTPGDSKTEFKVASLLDSNKQVFNKTIITLPGSIS
jgi:hypothetical protein